MNAPRRNQQELFQNRNAQQVTSFTFLGNETNGI